MSKLTTELEIILVKFANKVLDAKNGLSDPTLGELVDEPTKELEALISELLRTTHD